MRQTNSKFNLGLLVIITTVIYCAFNKYKVFTIFGVRTDFVFWLLLGLEMVIGILMKRSVRVNLPILCMGLFTVLTCVNTLMRNANYYSIVAIVFNVLGFVFLSFMYGRRDVIRNEFRLWNWIGAFFVLTVLLQAVAPELINNLKYIVLNSQDYAISQRGYMNTTRYLSGLASSTAVAAFFIVMYCSIKAADFLRKKQIKSAIAFGIGIVALLLTQKRTLFFSIIISTVAVVLICKRGIAKKISFLLVAVLAGAISAWIIIETVPAAQIFVNRLIGNEEFLSGRETFYVEMWEWFKSAPVFGVGIGTADKQWGYGGHNCYLQLLAETGIVGFVLYGIAVVSMMKANLRSLVRLWSDKSGNKSRQALYYQLAACIALLSMFIYMFTGNMIYEGVFCLPFICMLCVSSQIKNRTKGSVWNERHSIDHYPRLQRREVYRAMSEEFDDANIFKHSDRCG